MPNPSIHRMTRPHFASQSDQSTAAGDNDCYWSWVGGYVLKLVVARRSLGDDGHGR